MSQSKGAAYGGVHHSSNQFPGRRERVRATRARARSMRVPPTTRAIRLYFPRGSGAGAAPVWRATTGLGDVVAAGQPFSGPVFKPDPHPPQITTHIP